MIPEPTTSKYSLYLWPLRVLAAIWLITTIHYIGFFSTLSNNYFGLMSPSLVRRVTWELASTLAITSLYTAVYFFFEGVIRGLGRGVTNIWRPSGNRPEVSYAIDPFRVAVCYISVISVSYFPAGESWKVRSLYFSLCVFSCALAYFVFFHKYKENAKAGRLFSPLRNKEVAVRALIAGILSLSYIMGSGLARSIEGKPPITISTKDEDIKAIIIDKVDSGILVEVNTDLLFIPAHEIKRIKWRSNE